MTISEMLVDGLSVTTDMFLTVDGVNGIEAFWYRCALSRPCHDVDVVVRTLLLAPHRASINLRTSTSTRAISL
jgi:hypothetical protein